ncbi:MAG TPA: sialidase family protein [Planctomycetaceae bacterium]|nr:sialidase family protein [Planctomycetaceae bacterium]
MQLEERGLIFDAARQPDEARVNAFTSVARLTSGLLIAGHQSGSAKHAIDATLRLNRSNDGGRTWETIPFRFATSLDGKPGSLSSGDIVELPSGRLLITGTWFDRSDPSRPLFDPQTQGILHSRQVLAVSDDQGMTWGPWKVIPTPGLKGCASTGPMLSWSDGTIAAAFESYKEYDDPGPAHHAAWLIVSHDGGKTFPDMHLVAQHPEHAIFFWDQRLCAGKMAGEYFALFWTHDLVHQQDLNVHFKHGALGEGAPVRRGSPDPADPSIKDTAIPGQIAAPLLLDDGRLLAFVVDRHRPGSMTLWCSHDQGLTWPEKEKLVVHWHDERAALTQQGATVDYNEYWDDMLKWSFGHPALVDLKNGKALCVFYAGTPGALSIHWARIDLGGRSSNRAGNR